MTNLIEYDSFFKLIEQAAYEVFIECEGVIDESNGSPSETALKNKSKKSGFPLGILRQVYKRGYASWKLGHRPGVPPQAWAMARVNSFIVGGKTTKMADKALYKRAKEAKRKKNE